MHCLFRQQSTDSADYYDRKRRLFAQTAHASEEEYNAARTVPTVASFVGSEGLVRRVLNETCMKELFNEENPFVMIRGRYFQRSSFAPGLKYAVERYVLLWLEIDCAAIDIRQLVL